MEGEASKTNNCHQKWRFLTPLPPPPPKSSKKCGFCSLRPLPPHPPSLLSAKAGLLGIFLHTMSRSPLLAPCRAARKQPQRRTSLYLCTTRRGQVIFRGGLWNAVGGRLTGEAGDRRTGRMGGEGNDNVLPDSEGGRLPGGPHHATSPSQA